MKLRLSSLHARRRRWHPTPVLLPGKSHGRRSLVGCSPWGREEWDTTEWLHFHFSLSCIGEGNGNPLQCSCLENPRDGGAWWAAVYGLHRFGHDWSSSSTSSLHAVNHWLLVTLWFSFSYLQKWGLWTRWCLEFIFPFYDIIKESERMSPSSFIY